MNISTTHDEDVQAEDILEEALEKARASGEDPFQQMPDVVELWERLMKVLEVTT